MERPVSRTQRSALNRNGQEAPHRLEEIHNPEDALLLGGDRAKFVPDGSYAVLQWSS
jgi:hypothetical protein